MTTITPETIRNADRSSYDSDARAKMTPHDYATEQFAGAIAVVMGERPMSEDRDAVSVGVYVGDVGVWVTIEKSATNHDDPWGVWATVRIATPEQYAAGDRGWRCGNRYGGVNTITKIFAPVIANMAEKGA